MANTYKINDVEYECEFKFTNSDGQEMEYTNSAVRGLTIIDNIFNPFISGSIGIASPYDIFEDKFLLRGDGRDELSLSINPTNNPKDKIEETFILVEEENYGNPEVRSENIKKFSILHKDSLPFMDKIPYGISYSGKAGEILKEIFKELLGDEKVDEEDWEDGDFTLTYHPPLTFRYIDVVYYLLQHYYAKDGDMYVKGFINYKLDKQKYKLALLSKIFEENSDNVIEAFTVSDFATEPKTENPNNPPPDAEVSQFNNGLKNFAYSTPMYKFNNDLFLNTIIYGYDPILGIHKKRILRLDDIKKKWEKKFVESFKSIGGKPKGFLPKNKTTEQKFRHYRTPYSVEDSVKMVEADVYNNLTFYNLQCSFTNLGSLNRSSGKFLDIAKIGDVEQKSDEKLLGRWFVTEIRHIFLGDGYTNEFICYKTYVGPQSKISDDVE